MFIVTPYLTKEPLIYGIYALCISMTVFLNYADLGFLRSSEKYAAESFSKNDRENEVKFIGFGIFILFIFSLLITLGFLYFAYNPEFIIKDLVNIGNKTIAANLLLILAIFTPSTVLNRMVSMIFSIRLENFIYQRISIITSIITLGSVFYFFTAANYQIVNYFLFLNIINFIGILVGMIIAKNRYNYNFNKLFSHIRFNKITYNKTKGLAYSGLFLMLSWIIFYELDQISIAKFLGAKTAAIYAIAFFSPNIFRTIFGIFFSPFFVRINYFVGLGDEEGLIKFCKKILYLTSSLVVFPTVALSIVAKPFILSWVGSDFFESIILFRLLTLVFTLSFISYPISAFLIAKEKLNEIYYIGIIQPVTYWAGITSTFSYLGIVSFPIFKLIATLISEIYYLFLGVKFLNLSVKSFFRKAIAPLVLPLIFLTTSLLVANEYLPLEKSKLNLLIVLFTTGASICISFLILLLTSSFVRKNVMNVFTKVFMKTKNINL